MSNSEHEIITISEQPIELCKLLKIANMVSGGGEAKIVISEGYVLVNGEVEFRKRKKINAGDVIEFNGETIAIELSPANTESLVTKKETTDIAARAQDTRNSVQQKTAKKTNKKKAKLNHDEQVQPNNQPNKRRPISF